MHYYIVNPSAGNDAFADMQHKLKRTLRDFNIDGEFAKTLKKHDARKITRAAVERDFQTIVVVGGDTTVNEVITAVHESGARSVAVGIIPIGRQNTLARFLGIEDWQQACRLLAARRLQSYNLVHVNDHSFIHSCHIAPRHNDCADPVLAEIDGTYKLRGDIAATTVANQKIHNPHLPNELLLRFWPPGDRPSWWQRLSAKHSPVAPPTQLHARVAILEFANQQTTTIDGRTLHDSRFRIRLSQTPIRLITAAHQEEFDRG
jgi:hypothetical protein